MNATIVNWNHAKCANYTTDYQTLMCTIVWKELKPN